MSGQRDEELTSEEITEQGYDEAQVGADITDSALLQEARQDADEWKDKYFRAYADFENTKKRLEKDKSSAVSYANEGFAKDILSVIDSFEQALASIETAQEGDAAEVLAKMKEGVFLTYGQLKKILEKNYIKEIICEGLFDPNLHQAIMQVESDAHQSGEIVQVMQKGYTIKDRVLRPSIVSTKK